MACILGRSLAPKSNNQFKQFTRELNPALPGVEASQPLKWSQYTIAFDAKDHPRSTKTVGTLPLVCTRPSTTLLSAQPSLMGVQA